MEEIESGEIPDGTEMTEEAAAIVHAQQDYMTAKDKVIAVIKPWVVTINGVSLSDEVATLVLAALDIVYPAHPTRDS